MANEKSTQAYYDPMHDRVLASAGAAKSLARSTTAGQAETLIGTIGKSLEELGQRLDELEVAIAPALEPKSEAPAVSCGPSNPLPATSPLTDRLFSVLRRTETAIETVCSMTRRSTL